MRILQIIDSLSAGGAEKVVLTLAKEMQTLGHEVTVLTINDVIEYEIDYPIEIYTINFEKKHYEPTYFKYSIKLMKKISQLEQDKGKFDLIFSHLQIAHKLLSKTKIPNVYYCIHSALSPGSIKNKRRISSIFRKWKLRKLYFQKDIIGVSNGIVTDLVNNLHIKPKSIRTIYNPFDFQKIKELSQEENPFAGQNYVINAARFTGFKRHDRLLRAYNESKIPEKLLLLGDGQLSETIKSEAEKLGISEKVIFAGFHQNPYPILKDARLFILSSDYEGFGNVLVESLILGTPAISTDCPSGPREILTGDLAQYLTPLGNEKLFAENISKAINAINAGTLKIDYDSLNRFDATHITNQYLSLPTRK